LALLDNEPNQNHPQARHRRELAEPSLEPKKLSTESSVLRRLQMDVVNAKSHNYIYERQQKTMVPTEGQRNQVVPSSHARQSPNYACFDGDRWSPRHWSRYLFALWELSLAT
jgi:hypothetical protein